VGDKAALSPSADDSLTVGQMAVTVMVLAALVLDGLDVQLLALLTPVILAEWRIDAAAFAPALTGALVGMAIGAWGGGALGDRIGRKPILVLSTITFGLATAAGAATHDVLSLTALRVASGIGFGAAMPNGYALVTEWLPRSARARGISVLSIAAPAGGIIGAGASLLLLKQLGWRGCFVGSGVLTVLFGLAMAAWLPESPSHLLRKGKILKAQRELWRITRTDGAHLIEADPDIAGARGSLAASEFRRLNIGGRLAFFCAAIVTYAISSWMPTVLTGAGLHTSDAIRGGLYYNLAATVSALAAAALIERWGSARVLVTSCTTVFVMIGAIGAIILWGAPSASAVLRELLLVAVLFAGGASGVVIATIYAILSFGYPAGQRSTGIGMGVMAGRLGGILAVFSGGFLLSFGTHPVAPFVALPMAATLLGAASAFIIDRHVPARGRAPSPRPQPPPATNGAIPSSPATIQRQT
jgi:MFS transporter, AAHS family, 4-hydroxybenzoate transporter